MGADALTKPGASARPLRKSIMAETLVNNASILLQLQALMQNTVDGGNLVPNLNAGVNHKPAVAIANGTGASQANRFWQSSARPPPGAASFRRSARHSGTFAGPGRRRAAWPD